MKIVKLSQGSPEWHAHRARHFNASDAPAMMGCSPYKTRAQLLRELHTGVAADVDASTQRAFDDGHRAEALARPLAERIISDELYPCVGTEGRYSASFDGLPLGAEVNWEHKALNDTLRAALPDAMFGVGGPEVGAALPLHYRVQMEQQCMVSGAGRALFTASRWASDGELIEARHCWYEPDAELRAAIIAGWQQFAADLAAYVPPPAAEPAAVGKAPESLPALRIEVTGMVTASNLAEFKATALAAIQSVNRVLKTDQDFADARKSIRWCEDIESRLKAAKEHALSQTVDIDALFKAVDDISAEARRVRLDLDKVVTKRSVEVKEEAVTTARAALDKHIAALNAELAPMRLQPVAADFAGAIKGLRSIASMQDALDVTLANGKIAADAQARGIRANVAAFKSATGDDRALQALFADLGQLVHRDAEHFAAVLDQRITRHRANEAARKAADDARIAAAAQAAREQAEREAAERLKNAQPAVQSPVAQGGVAENPVQSQPGVPCAGDAAAVRVAVVEVGSTAVEATAPSVARLQPVTNEPATLKLGTICERLGFVVSAAFLADVLHIPHRGTDKAAKLYRESDWPLICRQLQAHISAMSSLHGRQQAA